MAIPVGDNIFDSDLIKCLGSCPDEFRGRRTENIKLPAEKGDKLIQWLLWEVTKVPDRNTCSRNELGTTGA